MKDLTRIAAVAAVLAASSGAFATDIQLRVGAANVAPKSDNNALVKVESATQLSLGATVYFSKNFAIDVLGALPSKHDIKLTAAGAARRPPRFSCPLRGPCDAALDIRPVFVYSSPRHVVIRAGVGPAQRPFPGDQPPEESARTDRALIEWRSGLKLE
jgi:hypothetical protein